MTLWQGSSAELVTAAIAAVAIPFYLGFIHSAPPQLIMYSAVAGTAMATGELVETPRLKRAGVRIFIADAAVWSVAMILLGGAAYLLALIF